MWRGVLIEEAFKDKTILVHVSVLGAELERLEGEGSGQSLHFDKVEFRDTQLDTVLDLAQRHINIMPFERLFVNPFDE